MATIAQRIEEYEKKIIKVEKLNKFLADAHKEPIREIMPKEAPFNIVKSKGEAMKQFFALKEN
jgi:hypothetical protein